MSIAKPACLAVAILRCQHAYALPTLKKLLYGGRISGVRSDLPEPDYLGSYERAGVLTASFSLDLVMGSRRRGNIMTDKVGEPLDRCQYMVFKMCSIRRLHCSDVSVFRSPH